MSHFCIKSGDTLPTLEMELRYADGTVPNLTNATVVLWMKHKVLGITKSFTGTVSSITTAKVTYSWQAGNTTPEGDYDAEWRTTFPGGLVETFPSDSYFLIKIVKSLAT